MLCLLILIKHLLLPCVCTRHFFFHFFTIFCTVGGICFASFYTKSIYLKHTSIHLDLNLGHFATLEVFQVTHFQMDQSSLIWVAPRFQWASAQPQINQGLLKANLVWIRPKSQVSVWCKLNMTGLSRPSGRDPRDRVWKEEVPSNNLGRWLNELSMRSNQIWSFPVERFLLVRE